MKVKFPKEQIDLFNNIGTIVNTAEGSVYRYLPFWFKETEEEGVYELFTFEQLPDEFIEIIAKEHETEKCDITDVSKRYSIEDIERYVENWGMYKVEKEYIVRFLNG